MLGVVSSRSTRQLKQDPESKSATSLWQSLFPREDKVSLLLLNELSTQLRRFFCWHKRVSVWACACCVCVCASGCCLLRGHRQEFRSLQLSRRDVNIYDTLSAIWYVWTLSPPDIYFRYLHISITFSSITRRNRRAIKWKLTIEMCFIFHSVCSEQVKIYIYLYVFLLLLIQGRFPIRVMLYFSGRPRSPQSYLS